MTSTKKHKILTMLKGIETGDPAAVTIVNEEKYIQHNPQTHEGSEGLAALFKRLSKSSPRVNIVRVFEDGDYVFAHTEYDFAHSNIGFEVFRFEDGRAVEHWDNIQRRAGPNSSGHTMVDGPTEATDVDRTSYNRDIVRSFAMNILVNGKLGDLSQYISEEQFTEHDPKSADGIEALRSMLTSEPGTNETIEYHQTHRILAEGSFVLSVSEGAISKVHSSFYDLFRVAEGKIVEHWNTVEAVPLPHEWKNENGKF